MKPPLKKPKFDVDPPSYYNIFFLCPPSPQLSILIFQNSALWLFWLKARWFYSYYILNVSNIIFQVSCKGTFTQSDLSDENENWNGWESSSDDKHIISGWICLTIWVIVNIIHNETEFHRVWQGRFGPLEIVLEKKFPFGHLFIPMTPTDVSLFMFV